MPKNPYKADFAATTSKLVVPGLRLRLADQGQRGHGDRQDFLQLHFHIKKDYLNRDLLQRGNFYQSN